MTYSHPLVTVLTPTYNGAAFLPETIESVLNQTHDTIEYIVLDDGSTDNTVEILKAYETRLRWETHENVGESRTVNEGWRLAKGDYVMTVNADDPILPRLVEATVEILEAHPDALVAYPDWYMIDASSQRISEPIRRDYNYRTMLQEYLCLVGPGALIRRKALELAPERSLEYRFVADFEYWLRLGLYGPFVRVPEALATHRVHEQSATIAHRGVEIAQEHVRLIDSFFERDDLPDDVRSIETEGRSAVRYLAGTLCLPHFYGAARRYFTASLKSPTYYRKHPGRLLYVLSVLLTPAPLHSKFYHRWMAHKRPHVAELP